MAEAFKGTATYPSAGRTGTELPQKIVSFTLYNKAGGANAVSVQLGGVTIYSESMADGDVYESVVTRILKKNEEIVINVSGELDYYFSLMNLTPGVE